MKQSKLFAVIGCLALIGSAACSTGLDGIDGAQGPQGPPGLNGADGSNGTNGTNGTDGTNGAKGDQGEVGSKGDTGDTGATGAQGDAGVSLCGDVPMPQWHQACGSDLTQVCQDVGLSGEWECHLFLSSPDQSGDVTESQKIVCADATSHKTLGVPASLASEYPGNASVFTVDGSSVLPSGDTFGGSCGGDLVGVCATSDATWSCLDCKAGCVSDDAFVKVAASQTSEYPNSCVDTYSPATCNDPADCSGAKNTTGDGTKVALIRDAVTYLPSTQNSQGGGTVTLVAGVCRNAVEHCLASSSGELALVSTGDGTASVKVSFDGLGNPLYASSANLEGVTLADFTADPKEGSMGDECTGSDGLVHLMTCVVGDDGVASVQCAGAIQ